VPLELLLAGAVTRAPGCGAYAEKKLSYYVLSLYTDRFRKKKIRIPRWAMTGKSIFLEKTTNMKYSVIYNVNLRAYLMMDGLLELLIVEDGPNHEIFREI
jgi:hypothetical protein